MRIPDPRRPVVLAYHGVNDTGDDADPDRLVLAPALLEQQVRLLQRLGYRFLTAAGILEETGGGPLPPRTAVLTFDDGWADALDVVTPLLHRLGVPASFYVCPGWFGGQHPLVEGHAGRLLDATEARALHDAGMEVASHSMRHHDLRLLGDEELADDLARSRAAVEAVTGVACRTFAYPYGLFDERVEAAVGAAGYELALAWTPGPWRPLAVPRLAAPPRHGARRLGLKLAGVRRRTA